MPYLFNDMIEGYRIQKKVIRDFFRNTEHSNLNGPSIMLLIPSSRVQLTALPG